MLFHLKQIHIPLYGILIFVGGIISIIVSYFLLGYKKNVRKKTYFFAFYFYILPGIILFCLFAWLFDNFFHYLNNEPFGSSGISFLGGCVPLMTILFVLLSINKTRSKLYKIIDCTVLVIPLIHCFGRIGCFFGGCCFGIASSWGVVYWDGSAAAKIYGYGTPVLPVQLFESIFCLCLFLVLLIKLKKDRFFYYSLIYGVYRFFGEFLRGDNRGSTGTILSPSQLMSLVLIVLGTSYYFLVMKKIQNRPI